MTSLRGPRTPAARSDAHAHPGGHHRRRPPDGAIAARRGTQVRLERLASLPLGLYRIEPGPVRRGDLVLIRPPPDIAELAHRRGYLPKSAYLIKIVLAVAGDQVCRFGTHVIVRGVLVARALPRDTLGRRMPVWHSCRRLTSGELFVFADNPRSFDSRYFGVVSEACVVGQAVLVVPPRGAT